MDKMLERISEEVLKLDPPMENGDQQVFTFNDGTVVVEYEPTETGKRKVKVQVLFGDPVKVNANLEELTGLITETK